MDKIKLEQLYLEVDILKKLDHPNIIKLYEVIDTEFELVLVMEYAEGGELFDHLASTVLINFNLY